MSGVYRYRAATLGGAVRRGRLVASTEQAARQRLHDQGLLLLDLRVTPSRRATPPPARDVALMLRNLSAMLGAGLSLERALAATAELSTPRVAAPLLEVQRLIREGWSLSQAMAAAPGLIPDSLSGLLRAGERGSQLVSALATAAGQMEAQAELTSRVRRALAYPMVVACTGLLTVAVLIVVVIPRFALVLADLGTALPPLTQAVLVAGRIGGAGLPVLGLTIALVLVVMARLNADQAGRYRLHSALLKLPIAGPIRYHLAAARAASTLGALLGAGLPITEALTGAADSAGDEAIAARLRRAAGHLPLGLAVPAALAQEEAFPPLAQQLLDLGVRTGRLGELAGRAGDLTTAEANRRITLAVALIEPILIVGLGATVALVAGALLQAVYSLRPL